MSEEVFVENKEIIVCKFDNEIECTEYNCEYTCTELETLELDGEESCPLFKKEQLALLKIRELKKKIEAANKKLAEFPKCECFDHVSLQFAENKPRLKKWLEEMNALLFPRKEPLTCDKTKEPPCHLEPSAELCGKCELNNCEKEQH